MTSNRKVCFFKGCDRQPGHTLFKFPTDKDRFLVWAENAGLELNGEVNISEPRYLCEKHFSVNYISNQSRRKMLVHTAVPEKWNESETIEAIQEPTIFNIVGVPTEKKRKSQTNTPKEPKTVILNHKRKLDESFETTEEYIEEYEPQTVAQSDSTSTKIVYEEVAHPTPPKRTYKCLVVRKKSPKSPNKTVMNSYIKPSTDAMKDEETFFLTEDGNLSSTPTNAEPTSESINIDQKPVATTASSTSQSAFQQQNSLESYSEFIFNGEIYVQMPKRVFEEEKEKLRAETLKYKTMLMRLKNQIESCFEI